MLSEGPEASRWDSSACLKFPLKVPTSVFSKCLDLQLPLFYHHKKPYETFPMLEHCIWEDLNIMFSGHDHSKLAPE